ncbi:MULTISPECIES: LysR family transcriptional regulator [Kordiimonas]|jgi:DNA-binding transcriptional LysR family regulator|uniref:LysR family transcriptional regulator n=1 Tax=Kordiimonas TaxID=288021 RepID=UPI00257DFF04|nr:LysR family transcriptional regulator [Kordiimonas sp. UBA4487]
MELYQIRYFLSVSETLNFTQAAKQCNVSQPALTKAIKKLEEEVGADLLLREGRSNRLTTVGKLLRNKFLKLQANMEETVLAVQRSLNLDDTILHVAVMCSIGPQRYAPIFQAFKQKYPGIKLILTDARQIEVAEILLENRADCGLYAAEELLSHPRLGSIKLHDEQIMVACSETHRFANMEKIPMREAVLEPYLDRLHCEYRPQFLDFAEANHLPLQIVYSSEREDWIQAMLTSENGVCIMPENSATQKGVVLRPVCDPDLKRKVQLVYVSDREKSPAFQAFVDFLTEHPFDPAP